jgi:hypothetical protein
VLQTLERGEWQPWNWVERASVHPCKSGRFIRNLTPRRKSRAKIAGFQKKIEKQRHWAYAAPLKTFTAAFVYRRAVGDGRAAKRDSVHTADSRRPQAERREPPGPRTARCKRPNDASAQTFSASGRRGSAPLPGGLRRSAKSDGGFGGATCGAA